MIEALDYKDGATTAKISGNEESAKSKPAAEKLQVEPDHRDHRPEPDIKAEADEEGRVKPAPAAKPQNRRNIFEKFFRPSEKPKETPNPRTAPAKPASRWHLPF